MFLLPPIKTKAYLGPGRGKPGIPESMQLMLQTEWGRAATPCRPESGSPLRLILCGLSDAQHGKGVTPSEIRAWVGLVAKDEPPGSTANPKGLLLLLEALEPRRKSQRSGHKLCSGRTKCL